MTRTSALLALSMGIWAGLAGLGFGQSAGEGLPELTMMTFNIRYDTASDGDNAWPNRKELVAATIREQKPDVVGLQEALRHQLDELVKALPEYGEIGVGRDDGQTKGEYAAILYRKDRLKLDERGTFWFSEEPDTPGSNAWDQACPRICTWARLLDQQIDRGVYVYNVHLDHVSATGRMQSIRILSRRAQGRTHNDPVVVMGDFNMSEDDVRMQFLVDKFAKANSLVEVPLTCTLVDVFRAVHPAATDVGTYHAFRGIKSGKRIDYIFASSEFKPTAAEIVHAEKDGRYPSDHFPVVGRIQWRSREAAPAPPQ